MDPRLPRLALLAELVESRDAGVLARLDAEARGLEAAIAALRGSDAPAEPTGYTLGGHDALWDRWRQSELSRLNRSLADLRVRQIAARQAAARATARAQVVGRLAGRERP